MAKGLEKHQDRERKLSLFGKELTRRSRSSCELCGGSGSKLAIYELEPAPKDPEFDRCLFLCQGCLEPLRDPRKFRIERWRFLNQSIWSEITVVQVLSARILEKIGKTEKWAADLLEEAYLEEDALALKEEQPLG